MGRNRRNRLTQAGSRSRSLTAGGGAALTILLATVGCGGSGIRQPDQGAGSAPDLQTLIAKMRDLHVTSERYTRRMTTTVKGPKGTERSDDTLIGEVGLSPNRGETFQPGTVAVPIEVVVRGKTYSYSSALAGCDGGRPWVLRGPRSGTVLVIDGHAQVKPSRPERPARALLPFQTFPGERTRGGTGPFGGLINLLETATDPVRSMGVATVDGERTTEFSALVDPASLLVGASETELPGLRPPNEDILILQQKLRTLPTQLHVYLSDSGLPVRIT